MKLEVYRRADGLWAWRLKAKNGRIIATDGGQGYERRHDCLVSGFKATNAPLRAQDIEISVEPEPPAT